MRRFPSPLLNMHANPVKTYVKHEKVLEQLGEMDGEHNHVHLLVNYPPKHWISALMNSWKGVLWSPSYLAASCGGAPSGVLKQYIEQQKTPL